MATQPLTMIEGHGIKPVNARVLVEAEESATVKRMKAMGLEVAEQTKERDHHASMTGKIVAVSDDVRFGLAIGQRITFGRYAGTFQTGLDGNEYRMIDCEDVKGVYHG